jgi:hypothetical protein
MVITLRVKVKHFTITLYLTLSRPTCTIEPELLLNFTPFTRSSEYIHRVVVYSFTVATAVSSGDLFRPVFCNVLNMLTRDFFLGCCMECYRSLDESGTNKHFFQHDCE